MYKKLKNWKKIKQKSEEWFNERNKVITASDVSSILEINPFTSKYDVLQKKINIDPAGSIIENDATNWGEFHEPLAREYYETMPLFEGPRRVIEVGLIHHPKYKWLAASPDGIVESLEQSSNNIKDKPKWWLLEIKCPYKREFKNKGHSIPSYIWIQIQIQMEVCDLPFCHLLQCKYTKLEGVSHLLNKRITTIKRDSDWFNNTALPKLLDFWDLMKKSEIYNNFVNPFPNPKTWVSLSSFTGFLLKDPILDWLNMYENSDVIKMLLSKQNVSKGSIDITGYKNKVNKKNNIFKSIIENLKKYGNENNKKLLYITDIDEKWNENLSVHKYEITKNALENKTDIIIRPVLLDYKRQIYGIPDILIKNNMVNDFIEKYYKNGKINGLKYLSKSKKNKFKNGYTAFCVTIKNNFPKKCSLGKWDNVSKNRYTGFASIINSILDSNNTFISLLGANTCIVFDPETVDSDKCEIINNGIKWVKTLREKGEEWIKSILSDKIPTNSYIMPNMCNKLDHRWRNVKKELAERWGELTLLWYCGIDQRNRAHKKGVFSWKTLGMTSEEIVRSLYAKSDDNSDDITDITEFSSRKRIINSMISLNRTENKIYTSRNFGELTEPFCDTENVLEVFIDFEVLSGKNINKHHSKRLRSPQDIIYLVGMQWVCKKTNKMKFNSFTSSALTLSSEKKMLKDWWEMVKKLKRDYKVEKVILYHWSPAEERFLNKAFKRHSLEYIKSNLTSGHYDLRDLMEMFVDAEVIIRNVWGYSVKDVAKGLHKHGLILKVWNDTEKGGDSISSGEGTLITATNCYNEILNSGMSIDNNPNFESLREYNKIDCEVLYHLLEFLRNYVYSNNVRQKRLNSRKRKMSDDIKNDVKQHKKSKKNKF